ncbi:MAG: site-2 protease family protein [Nitrosomonadales bacterium]|nr:site-2 protease family protein [Nitrosomonadales bacterium]
MDQLIQIVALGAIPVLFAITLHEAAHGYVARHFGDNTAHQQGRISLNPIRHVDPLGTILVPILMLWSTSGGFMFGWAKPVPVNFGALHNPKRDMLWVALAGPATNLAMALFWALLIRLGVSFPDNYFAEPLVGMAQIGIEINLMLMILNLLPLPPLDGGRVAISLLPYRLAVMLAKIEPYGMVILIVLAVTSVLGAILSPLFNVSVRILSLITGI